MLGDTSAGCFQVLREELAARKAWSTARTSARSESTRSAPSAASGNGNDGAAVGVGGFDVGRGVADQDRVGGAEGVAESRGGAGPGVWDEVRAFGVVVAVGADVEV
jgi:hypothetical protein